jgi:hypothetical protein
MSATTLFTVYKDIQPDAQTVEVYGEISVGDETIDISSDVTVEFDEEQRTVEITEEDIAELYPREARMLLSALLKHHVKPAVEALAEDEYLTLPSIGAPVLPYQMNRSFIKAFSAMQEIIERAESLDYARGR